MTVSSKVLETGNSVREHSSEEIQRRKTEEENSYNKLAGLSVQPPKQYNGKCDFRTENIQQSVNSNKQKWSCPKTYFMCQQLIGNS